MTQLEDCIGDIGYELKMVGVLANVATPVDLPYLGYGLLEAFLVHVRLLDDFLANQGRSDSLRATDYLPAWDGKGFLTKAERTAINAKVAHLSRLRQEPKARRDLINSGALNKDESWKRDELGNRALSAASAFVKELDGEARRRFDAVLLEAWAFYNEPHALHLVAVRK